MFTIWSLIIVLLFPQLELWKLRIIIPSWLNFEPQFWLYLLSSVIIMLSTLCYNNHNTTSLSHLSFFLMRTIEILFWFNGPGFSSFCLIFLVCQHILFRHDKLYITSCQQSTISFDNFPHFGFFLVDSGLTKVELFSVFIFLNEQNEVGSLQRSQDRPYAIYHILQFYAFLFDLIFDVFEVMNQCLKEILLFL